MYRRFLKTEKSSYLGVRSSRLFSEYYHVDAVSILCSLSFCCFVSLSAQLRHLVRLTLSHNRITCELFKNSTVIFLLYFLSGCENVEILGIPLKGRARQCPVSIISTFQMLYCKSVFVTL